MWRSSAPAREAPPPVSRHTYGNRVSDPPGPSRTGTRGNARSFHYEDFDAAVEAGDVELVTRMLERGVALPEPSKNRAFAWAAVNGHAGVVELLLPRVDPVTVTNAIQDAAKNGHAGVVALLLGDGRGDPTWGANHAIKRAAANGYTDVVALLLPFADNQALQDMFTRAVCRGAADIVELLLEDGRADPAASDNWAIRTARKRGHADVVELLLADGRADPNAYPRPGKRAHSNRQLSIPSRFRWATRAKRGEGHGR